MYIVNPYWYAGQRFYDNLESYDIGDIFLLTSGVTYYQGRKVGFTTGYFITGIDKLSFDDFEIYSTGTITVLDDALNSGVILSKGYFITGIDKLSFDDFEIYSTGTITVLDDALNSGVILSKGYFNIP